MSKRTFYGCEAVLSRPLPSVTLAELGSRVTLQFSADSEADLTRSEVDCRMDIRPLLIRGDVCSPNNDTSKYECHADTATRNFTYSINQFGADDVGLYVARDGNGSPAGERSYMELVGYGVNRTDSSSGLVDVNITVCGSATVELLLCDEKRVEFKEFHPLDQCIYYRAQPVLLSTSARCLLSFTIRSTCTNHTDNRSIVVDFNDKSHNLSWPITHDVTTVVSATSHTMPAADAKVEGRLPGWAIFLIVAAVVGIVVAGIIVYCKRRYSRSRANSAEGPKSDNREDSEEQRSPNASNTASDPFLG